MENRVLRYIVLFFISLPVLRCAAGIQSDPNTQGMDPQTADLIREAEQGDAGAQYLLGFMYAEGQGLPQDYGEAIRWYTRAAELGHPDAPVMLAAMYLEGQGMPKDVSEAIRWYRMAARQGQAGAQFILSELLAEEQPTEANLVEAYRWSVLAQQGGQNVSEIQKRLAEHMTAEQIAQAQKQVEEWGRPLPAAESLDTKPTKYVSAEDRFAVQFPFPPIRTVVQDSDRILAIHYQSSSGKDQVQYNVSLQRFKDHKILDKDAQDEFIEDYIVTRAFLSWKSKLLKKSVTFRGLRAFQFKHTTYAEGRYTLHEGIIFFDRGDFVSLTCVYPSRLIPSPGFREYLESFELLASETSAGTK